MNEDIACGAEWQTFWYEESDDTVFSDSGEYEYGTPEFWDIAADLWGITEEECEDDEMEGE